MLRTIQISPCMSVQGPVIRNLGDGRVAIRVEDRVYEGVPLSQRIGAPLAATA